MSSEFLIQSKQDISIMQTLLASGGAWEIPPEVFKNLPQQLYLASNNKKLKRMEDGTVKAIDARFSPTIQMRARKELIKLCQMNQEMVLKQVPEQVRVLVEKRSADSTADDEDVLLRLERQIREREAIVADRKVSPPAEAAEVIPTGEV